ncbi:MAG: ABC transporter permease subunit [Clostridiales bacterium]|nr:ABC transporter permease subunit [Clostridiales bacterium]
MTAARVAPRKRKSKLKAVAQNWQMYLMAAPAAMLLFLFSYLPMAGLVVAFKRYSFDTGIFGSPWADPWYKNFEILFKNNPAAFTAMRNTLFLNAMFILAGTVFALALALSFNELRSPLYKRITQSLSFLPFFISTVVVGVFVSGMLAYETGSLNGMLQSLGLRRVNFYMKAEYWPLIMLIVNIWKGAGYNSIVYLAAISGIDTAFYEAAEIDGASRMQQIWRITLPLLRPTVIILTIMAVGRIMNSDFGLFFNVTRDIPTLYPTVDVIDTYIYRALRKLGDIGISSATGFFQSVVSLILVLSSNKLANGVEEGSALF